MSRTRPEADPPRHRRAPALLCLAVVAACTAYQPFDSGSYLQDRLRQRLPPDLLAEVEVPFELGPEVVAAVDERLSPAGSERRRTDEILSFIFGWLDLEYSLTPTRDATQTFHDRQGNCLSFVNLFVGVARRQRLNPFYVEVQDYQRWNYKDGVVVSRGHIVAGLNIDGQLSTYDFLPYRPKSYRDFKPIDDLAAMAHFYNNLAAEALMTDDLARAEHYLAIATALAPDFEKAANNLGVVYLRRGELARARTLFEKGIAAHPDNVAFLTNLARTYQELGRAVEAARLLAQLETVNQGNPYFYVYRGEWALAEGNTDKALEYLREALRLDSEVPEVHVALLKLFLATGDLKRARHHLERALQLDATHAEARRYAALLERAEAAAR